jgi:hypothetical protein
MEYTREDIEELSAIGIYLLMEKQGADVFGLWSADKDDLVNAYGQQIGFKA